MNRACIVRAHGAGLFSNINKCLVCLRIYDQVYVDWSAAGENDPAFKYGGSFYGDAWRDLFYDPTPRPQKDFDTIYSYPFYDCTDKCAGILYQHPEWNWREAYYRAWKRLTCMVEPIPIGPDTVGVLIRSDNHAGEQLSGRSQPLEEYAHAIQRELIPMIGDSGPRGLFIVSTTQDSIDWLQARFPNSWYSTGIKRSAKRSDPDQHLTVPQTVEDAKQCMREVLTLARCKALVHPISNMATAALIINPQMKSVYLK